MLHIIGKSDVLEKQPTIVKNPRFALKENEIAWMPEALTFPPERATTEAPHGWFVKYSRRYHSSWDFDPEGYKMYFESKDAAESFAKGVLNSEVIKFYKTTIKTENLDKIHFHTTTSDDTTR